MNMNIKRNGQQYQFIAAVACKTCEQPFFPKYARTIYCSPECRKIGRRIYCRIYEQKHRGHIPMGTPVNCRQCGASFVPNHQSQRLCSPECQKERHRIQHREYMRKRYHRIKNERASDSQ